MITKIKWLVVVLLAGRACALANLIYLSEERSVLTSLATSHLSDGQAFDVAGNPISASYLQSARPSIPFADFDCTLDLHADWYMRRVAPDSPNLADLLIDDRGSCFARQSSFLSSSRIAGSGVTYSGFNWFAQSYAESVFEITFRLSDAQFFTFCGDLYNGPGSPAASFALESAGRGSLYSFESMGGFAGHWSGSFSGVLEPGIYTILAAARNGGREGDATAWNFDFAIPDAGSSAGLLGSAMLFIVVLCQRLGSYRSGSGGSA